MKFKKLMSIFMIFLIVFSTFSMSSFGLNWDGSSSGGSTNAINGSNTGYVIRSTDDDNCVVGYRFSAVDSSGNLKVNKVIDVFRKTENGNSAYTSSLKFSSKLNKKQLITKKDEKLSTTNNTTNCYKENMMGFTTDLPNPSGVETWQKYENNINKVLSKIGVGSTGNMIYGDKVIIEPLFDVCLAGSYHAITVSEIAFCGRSVLGGSSNGGTSNGTSSTWGFIANYTNRIWPNKLFTPDGQGLWDGVSSIGSSSKATFNTILTKGYGAGIAYTEKTKLTYTIRFNGNGSTSGSTASMSMTYGEEKNLTANSFEKTGNTFIGWNTKADGTGTNYADKQSVKNLTAANGAIVDLYAKWSPYVLTIAYDCYGSNVTIDTSKHYSLGTYNRLCTTYYTHKTIFGTENVFHNSFAYNSEIGGNGLHDFDTFGLIAPTGYKFTGWKGNNRIFDEKTTSYKPTDFTDSIATGNATVWLTAQFSPITYTVKYNANGGSGVTASSIHTYDVAKNLTANGFSRSGYTFSCWNTKADGTGTNYTNIQSVKNMTATDGSVINLYAVWIPSGYTVTYNANGGIGAPSSQTKQHGVDLNLSSVTPTRTGYTFVNWNTKSNGTGTSYNSGSKYKTDAAVTLYAQWTPNVLTVVYDCYGSNVTMNTSKGYFLSTYNRICSQTHQNKSVAGTSNVYYETYSYNNAIGGQGLHNFSDFGLTAPTGYKFSGWKANNKIFNETTTTYKPTDFTDGIKTGNTYVWLTAQFDPITYTVRYNSNGGSGTTTASTHTYNTDKNLTANGFYRSGYTFAGWNTKADGTGTSYTNMQSVKNMANTTATAKALFGGWAGTSAGSKIYNDKQNVNNLSSINGAVVNIYAKWIDGNVTLPSPVRTGYIFSGWYTSPNNGTKIGNGGDQYTPSGNITVYARWTPITYTIQFDGNGNTDGSTDSMTMTYDEAKNLTATGFTKTGYEFMDWNISPDGSSDKYLDRQSVKNLTAINGATIILYAQWRSARQLMLEAVVPNAAYREKTQVVSSFNLVNLGSGACVPNDNVSVIFKVYKDGDVIKTVTKDNVVVPGNEKNLLYFKWTVPENIGSSTIYISGEIVENGISYSLIKNPYETRKYTVSVTPDTQYEIGAPSGFILPSTPEESNTTATWSEWVYANGTFRKVLYGIGISEDGAVITPEANANATLNNGVWTMKSGYGFGILLPNEVRSINGYTMPESDAYTVSQYAIAKFPEFSYLGTENNFRTLDLIDNIWMFGLNGDYGRVHFTPLWFPDGNYTVSVTQSDMWTPAGMISRKINTNTVNISGSAYDDWYLN